MTLQLDPDRAIQFLDFVARRHSIWEQRQDALPQPWTFDPVLATKKFTNVYRWLDPGSQYVLSDLLHEDPTTFIMRCFLYRHTGQLGAWRALDGLPEGIEDLDATLEQWKDYRALGNTVFTGAYLVAPQPGEDDKLETVVNLTKRLLENGSFEKFVEAGSQEERFKALQQNKYVGDFMAMQSMSDFGWSTEFREDEFVVLGPGARKGAKALLNGNRGSVDAVHRWAVGEIRNWRDWPLGPPSWMDVQNCMCEASKYFRYLERGIVERPYVPANPGPQPAPLRPPLWV